MSNMPSLQDYLNANMMPPDPTPQGNDVPQASGTGNWLTAGLGSGFHSALSQVGSAVQAGAKLVGADQTAQSAADYAAGQRATAATYARQDLEDHPWSLPGMGYQLAQGAPSLAAMLGIGAVSAFGAPEEAAAGAGVLATAGARSLLGTGLAAYPLSVGANVQRQTDYDSDLTQGDAAKALGLGVPEAALQTILPHQIEGALANGVGGDLLNKIFKGAAIGAPTQAGVGAATEYLTGQMGDPNRDFASKANSVVQAALGGAFQGAVLGGAFHALAKTPIPKIGDADISTGVDQVLNGTTPQVETPQNVPVAPVAPPVDFNQGQQGALNLGDAPTQTAAQQEAQLLKQYGGATTTPDGQLDLGSLPQALASMVQRYPSAHLSNLVDQFTQVRNEGQLKPGDVMLHDAMINELNSRTGLPNALVHPEAAAGPQNVPAAPVAPPVDFNQGQQGTLNLGDVPTKTAAQQEAQLRQQYGSATTPDGQLDLGSLPQALASMVQSYPSTHLSNLVDQLTQVRNAGQLKPSDVMLHDAVINELNSRAGLPNALVHPEAAAGPPDFVGPRQIEEPTPPTAPGAPPTAPAPVDPLTKTLQDVQAKRNKIANESPPAPQSQPVPEEPVVKPAAEQAPPPQAVLPFEAPLTSTTPPFDVGQVRAENKGLPTSITDGVTSEEDLKTRLADSLQSSFASGGTGHPKVAALAEKLGVLDGGTIDPKYLTANRPPEPSKAVDLSGTKYADKSAMIERARQLGNKITADPDFMQLVNSTADQLNSRLASGKAPDLKGINKDISNLQDMVDGKVAQQKIMPTVDLTKDQAHYSEPANSNMPTPEMPAEVAKIKQTRAPKVKADAAAETPAKPKFKNQAEAKAAKAVETPVETPAKPKFKNQAEAKAAKAAQAVEDNTSKGPRPSQPIRDSLSKAYDLLDQLKASKVLKYDQTQESPEFKKYAATAGKTDARNAAKATAAGKPVKPARTPDELYKTFRQPIEAKQAAFQAELARHENVLDAMDGHAKLMDKGDLSGFKSVKTNMFGSELTDNQADNVGPDTQKLIEDYENHVQGDGGLMDTIREHTGFGPIPLMSPSGVVTQHDKNLAYLIHETDGMRNGKGILDYLTRNGSNAAVRELARVLQDAGVNSRVRLGGPGDRDYEYLKARNPSGRVAASYARNEDSIGIHAPDQVENSVLHEMTHAATLNALNRGGQYAVEMTRLFDHLKANSDGDHYGFTNVKEFVAEAFSNPTFQKFLMSQEPPPGSRLTSMWNAFKYGVFRMLGMTPRAMTAFDAVIDTAHGLMQENHETPAEINDAGLKQISNGANAIYARIADTMMADAKGKLLNVQEGWRKNALGWMTNSHISQVWGKLVPALKSLVALQHHDSVRADTLAKHSVAAYMKLKALPKDVQHFIEGMMARTAQNIDPSKTWAEHTWLHGSKNSAVYQREVLAANNEWRKLATNPKALEAYQATRASNEADRLRHQAYFARDLMHSQGLDGQYDGFRADPFAEYEKNRALHDDPHRALQFWQGVTDSQKQGMVKLRGELSGARDIHDNIVKSEEKRRAGERSNGVKVDEAAYKLRSDVLKDAMNERTRLTRNRDAIKSLTDDFDTADKRAQEGTYFHLNREGSHFVSGHISVDPTGEINEKNAEELSKRMKDAGFNNAAIMKGGENTNVYVRVSDASQMAKLRQIFLKAQDDGVLAKDKEVTAGEAGTTNIYQAISPVWMKRLIEAARSAQPDIPEGVSDETEAELTKSYQQQIHDLTRTMLNMTPENSLSRLYAHRENVQGFSPHMIESFGKSSIANARGTSRLSLADEMAQSMRDIKDQVRANNGNRDLRPNQILGGAQAASELIMREKNRTTSPPENFMDAVRQITHTFQVGSSPAYVFTLMTQVPTLSLPELAKTHGFANSALALGRAAPLAIKTLRAVMSGPDATRFGMRDETLLKAGLSQKDVDFLMTCAMRGDFHHSSYTQAMAGHGPFSHGQVGQVTAAANAMGLYAEMMPRVLTAIAARDLYEKAPNKANGMTLHDFVSDKVSQSQMDWAPSGNARQTTKQGMFGSMSPLINQFMGFQIRLTEKMYREVADLTGRGRTPEERMQAGRFLLGHSAAVAMFAGTLGLPMLSTAAAVYDRLKDLVTGEDGNDVQASYRTFLAHTFGKQTGEIIARGLPRAFGADFDHVGEGRILPGSTFVNALFEKRSMEDAEKDWLKSEAGSATGFLANLAFAARDFANRDYMNGLIKMTPEIMKGPSEALRIANRGFVDKNGARLPITANAFDIAMKVLGIDPAKEAEYDEVKRTATGLNTMRQLREKNITQHLVLAVNRGDTASEQYWMHQSQEYQQEHPGLMPPAALLGRAMQKSQRQAAQAQGTGMPMGVSLKDIATRGMVGFGNFRNK